MHLDDALARLRPGGHGRGDGDPGGAGILGPVGEGQGGEGDVFEAGGTGEGGEQGGVVFEVEGQGVGVVGVHVGYYALFGGFFAGGGFRGHGGRGTVCCYDRCEEVLAFAALRDTEGTVEMG